MKLELNILNPCPKEWEGMHLTENDFAKFCDSCEKNVYDVRNFSKKEFEDLRKKVGDNLCVRTYAPHEESYLFSKFSKKSFWQKTGKVGLIALSLFFGNALQAQRNVPDNCSVQQVETISNTIVLSGRIRGKGKVFLRKLESVSVKILVGKKDIELGEWSTDENGRFIIELEKEILDSDFAIQFSLEKYSSLTIREIPIQNTGFDIYLEKSKWERRERRRVWIGCPNF